MLPLRCKRLQPAASLSAWRRLHALAPPKPRPSPLPPRPCPLPVGRRRRCLRPTGWRRCSMGTSAASATGTTRSSWGSTPGLRRTLPGSQAARWALWPRRAASRGHGHAVHMPLVPAGRFQPWPLEGVAPASSPLHGRWTLVLCGADLHQAHTKRCSAGPSWRWPPLRAAAPWPFAMRGPEGLMLNVPI